MTIEPFRRAPARRLASWHGRRRIADARTRFVAVRCTTNEYASIDEAATNAGLSIGAFLRSTALGRAGPRSVRRPPIERRELARLLGHLGKVGSNVNQLAHACNRDGRAPALSELRGIQRELAEMRAALMKALGRDHQG